MLAKSLAGRERPIYYLAIPRARSRTSSTASQAAGTRGTPASCSRSPSGATWRRQRSLHATLQTPSPRESIFRIDHYLGKEAGSHLLAFRLCQPRSGADLGTATTSTACRSPWRSLRPGRAAAGLRGGRGNPRRRAEPPSPGGRLPGHWSAHHALTASRCATRWSGLRAVRPLQPTTSSRQFVGYRQEKGVAPGLQHRDLRRGTLVDRLPGAGTACPSSCAPASASRPRPPRVLVRLKQALPCRTSPAARPTTFGCASAPTS